MAPPLATARQVARQPPPTGSCEKSGLGSWPGTAASIGRLGGVSMGIGENQPAGRNQAKMEDHVTGLLPSRRLLWNPRRRWIPRVLLAKAHRAVIAAVSMFGLVAWAWGCGADTTGPEPPPPPPNRAPTAFGSIPPLTVTAGETVTTDVASYFRDPDGDALTYSTMTSHAGTASPTITGSSLTIAGVSPGTATVTVTARDPGGLTATQSAAVTVARPNQPPVVVGTIPPPTVVAGETVTVVLSEYFSDPDGDTLTYAASTSDPAIASPTTSEGTLTIAGVAPGTATVTIVARDPGGLSVQQSTAVTVASRITAVTVSPAADTIVTGDTLRLTARAVDAAGQTVTTAVVSWVSSDTSVAEVDASGLVRGVSEGVATVSAAAGSARGTAEIRVFSPDRAALVALYRATSGENWSSPDFSNA